MIERFLTPEAKVNIMANFEACKNEVRPISDLACKGYIDPDIIPLCDWLNSFEGICTLQSCAGHRIGNWVRSQGILWIWLDEKLAVQFRGRVFELVINPAIESVSQVYSRCGEYVEIIFHGNERASNFTFPYRQFGSFSARCYWTASLQSFSQIMQLSRTLIIFFFAQALIIQFAALGSFFSSFPFAVVISSGILAAILTPMPSITALLFAIFRHSRNPPFF